MVVDGFTGVTNIRVFDSVFSQNSASSPGTYNGAIFNASDWSFVNNRSGPVDGLTDTQASGLAVFAAANSGYTIVGNDLTGNMVSRLTDSGSGLAKTIGGNLGVDDVIPTQASAATFLLPVNPTVNVTGTTALSTINGSYRNRRQSFIFLDAAPGGVTTGGNVARAVAAVQDQILDCTFSGTLWYCK
jgi:hypothetical protein